jgi:succinate-semialdehyde dehydrogenase / glutarate-semialdehyde dehydrogenase
MIRDAAATVKKMSMELGANAPLIVFDNADLENALDLSVATKFANAGQVCVTVDRFFIHESLHDRSVDGFVNRARKIKLGDGLDAAISMGPLINAKRLEEIDSIVCDAVSQGAKLEMGGARAAGFNAGHFYEPTVLTHVRDAMKVFAEENFGPIAEITSFKDEADVLARANACEMGLSAYAFTKSPDRIRRVVEILNAGMVGINSFALAAAEAPFGGTIFPVLAAKAAQKALKIILSPSSRKLCCEAG